jgi:hypothetical protein
MGKLSSNNPITRHHHIWRIDDEIKNFHCWRFQMVRNNKKVSKQFSDSVYGGKRKALQIAIRYRDEILATTDLFEQQIRIRTELRRNNKSGYSGVRRYENGRKPGSKSRQVYWSATWTNEDGVKHSRSFSINLYGEEEAKQLAIAERERQLLKVCAIKVSHWRDPDIKKNRRLKPLADVDV